MIDDFWNCSLFLFLNLKINVTTLHVNLEQEDMVSSTYMDAKILLATTTNGFEFLQLLLHQVHPYLYINKLTPLRYLNNHCLKTFSAMLKRSTHIYLLTNWKTVSSVIRRYHTSSYYILTTHTTPHQLKSVKHKLIYLDLLAKHNFSLLFLVIFIN